jgi:hypothetical protein
MPKRIVFIEAEINRRLGVAVGPDSPNRVLARELREWARAYLGMTDEENTFHPEDAHRPHWDLWMRDRRLEDALFIVMNFRADCVEVYCGSGSAFAIRAVADRYTGFEPDPAYEAMDRTFHVEQSFLRIDRRAAALWLGRGWKP